MSTPPRPTPPKPKPSETPPRPKMNTSTVFVLLVLTIVVGFLLFRGQEPSQSKITYGLFRQELAKANIESLRRDGVVATGEFKQPPEDPNAKRSQEGEIVRLKKKFRVVFPQGSLDNHELDEELIAQLGENYSAVEPTDGYGMLMIVYLLVTVGLFALLWLMFRRARDQMFGGGVLAGFNKSPAKRYEDGERPVTFEDVAGLDRVKSELEEIVEFLKNPVKFQRLGGRVPKGVLLMGPPGTGKTLLGRAVAGEAKVPFFSITGSEFIQMFVGVGASRVRDMFAVAKESSPSILFIDEIDAVGRHRGTGLGGGHDEREQTLNQILSEMDGFTQTEAVIVMAATNRPDVLDPALLRPGRFDRHVTVDRPNHKGRVALFKVHTRDIPLSDDVDFDRLGASTIGLTGADIRNMANEAALWATRHDKDCVTMFDFEYARDKILMGPRRDEVLSEKEKRITAYHEAGHALLSWMSPQGDRVHKITIVPRGRALGATQLLPEEDRLNVSESDLLARLCFLLGGRTAEKLVFEEYSAGAEDDLKKATALARRMVTHWGMSERLGPVAFRASEDHPFLGREMSEPREFSEHTAQVIDEEIVRILRQASETAEQQLVHYRDKLDKLAEVLFDEEVVEEDLIEELIGPPAYSKKGKPPKTVGDPQEAEIIRSKDES